LEVTLCVSSIQKKKWKSAGKQNLKPQLSKN
jgi:hypothetical protein